MFLFSFYWHIINPYLQDSEDMKVVVLSLAELTCPAVKDTGVWRRVRLVRQDWQDGEVGQYCRLGGLAPLVTVG